MPDMAEILAYTFVGLLIVIFLVIKLEPLWGALWFARVDTRRRERDGRLTRKEALALKVSNWRVYAAIFGAVVSGGALYLWHSEIEKTVSKPPSGAENLVAGMFFLGLLLCVPLLISMLRVVSAGTSEGI